MATTDAAEPPATRSVTLPLPAMAFVAVIPEAAAHLEPFLAAEDVTLEQAVHQSAGKLAPGIAITRVVTTKGTGIPAMLLAACSISASR
jgi:hypothetical protein